MQISLPLDEDGFLRRECPTCEREFKWFHGATEGRPDDAEDPDNYFCPLCGVPAPGDQWWTPLQRDYVEAEALAEAQGALGGMLEDALRGNKKLSFNSSGATQTRPLPVTDVTDMEMVESPCHPWEPVKVPEGWLGVVHCLLCGERFVID